MTNCFGFRFLNSLEKTYFSDLKVGDSFTFNSGFKRFNNGVLVGQSKPATSLSSYRIVDLVAPATTTTTTTTNTGTVSTPYPTTAMPIPADPAPIWYAAIKGTFANTIATPTSYVIQPYSTKVGTGLSATINTLKAGSAYALFWNV